MTLRHVYPDYKDQDEANRQYAGALNDIAEQLPHTGVILVSDDRTLSEQFFVWLVDASGGAVTITVPPASPYQGKGWTIKKLDASNDVTLSCNDDIDGSTTQTLTSQYQFMTIFSDGSDWHIVAKG